MKRLRNGIAINSTSDVLPVTSHFHVPITIEEVNYELEDSKAIETVALIDSGASTTFINQRLAKEMQLKHYKFEQPIPLLNINGTKNTAGRITHYAQLHTSIP